jgi:hypothetical protein
VTSLKVGDLVELSAGTGTVGTAMPARERRDVILTARKKEFPKQDESGSLANG